MAKESQNQERSGTFSEFTRRVWLVIGATVSVVVLVLILWQLSQVLLLLFAGTLFAVFLRGLARPLAKRLPVGETATLIIVILLLILIATGTGVVFAPNISEQISSLVEALPEAVNSGLDYLEGTSWGSWIMERAPRPGDVADNGSGIVSNFFGVFSTALGAVANILFVIVVAIYLAANPDVYRNGVVMLVPQRHRSRAAEVVDTTSDQLWHWLKGQFLMMLIVGVLTTIGLFIAGVPLALALGVIAGVFEFVPIVGPFAAAIPGVLIALAHSPTTALYAIIVYLVVQQLESNAIAPIVMREMVSLPPALTLSATIIAGVMFGLPGVLFATPLALVAVIMIRMIYINSVLGDDVPPVPEYHKKKRRS